VIFVVRRRARRAFLQGRSRTAMDCSFGGMDFLFDETAGMIAQDMTTIGAAKRSLLASLIALL
jgi:hypothetical protein